MSQPVPQVSVADVDRVIGRDVLAARRGEVTDLLRQYTASDGPVPVPRVHLAILKLSGGDPAKVAEFIAAAKQDYRDVLAWAEYPRYSARGGFEEESEEQQAINDDWAEYKGWLERG
ncbi:MAG: hypothetical protein U0871_10285 [Gemmataceae bacterium]